MGELRLKAADIARPQFKANPYTFYAHLRSASPICQMKLLGQTTWLLTRYADVFAMLKDERFLKDWPPVTKWIHRLMGPTSRHMLNQDGDDHTRLRTLVHKAFAPHLMERLRERVENLCNERLDKLEAQGQLDLMSEYAIPLPLNVISELLGVPAEERNRMHDLSRSTLSASNLLGVVRTLPDLRRLVRRIRKLIAERRREPREDLITALVQAEEAGDKLSEKELVGTIALLLLAGYETTVNLIGNGALALMQHREALTEFQQNPGVGSSTIEELLRYTSPLDLTTQRFAREEVRLGSVKISRGQVVLGAIGSANHDEAQFLDPETFDITREPNKHLSFGQGAHFCIGAPLARLEGQIALRTLFRRFPDLQVAKDPQRLRWRKSLIVRGLEELPVRVATSQ